MTLHTPVFAACVLAGLMACAAPREPVREMGRVETAGRRRRARAHHGPREARAREDRLARRAARNDPVRQQNRRVEVVVLEP